MQPVKISRDVAAPWFRARRKLGIDDTIYFGTFEANSGRRHVLTLPHEQTDGTGVLRHFLRSHRLRDWQESDFPPRPVPGLWQCMRQHQAQPLAAPPEWQPRPSLAKSSALIALASFTVEQTAQVREVISASGLSVNVWLLHKAQQCLEATLLHSRGGSWFMPVSLRGAIELPGDEMNHASGFYFSVPEAASAAQLQAAMHAALKRGEHWWLWHQAALVSAAGQWCVDLLFRYFLKQQQHIGTFTTLGEWQVDWRGSALPEDSLLWGCPPTSPTHPAAFLWLLCNDRLVLSIKLNPVLGVSQSGCDALMRAWQTVISDAAGLDSFLPTESPADQSVEARYG